MYNKLFTKILDSSIWLEPTTTRIVWFTLLAAMDEDGFAQFASVANLAHRARVTIEDAEKAMTCLENPDSNSSDPSNEGRRVERVPGGWMVLNAPKYRDLVTRLANREATKQRVARHRAKKAGNGDVTVGNDRVTQSEAYTEAVQRHDRSDERSAVSGEAALAERKAKALLLEQQAGLIYEAYPRKVARARAVQVIQRALVDKKNSIAFEELLRLTHEYARARLGQQEQFTPHPSTWFGQKRYNDNPSTWPDRRDTPRKKTASDKHYDKILNSL